MGLGLNYKQKLMVGEHIIELPPLPKDKNDILFVDNCFEDAFWHRKNDYPEVFTNFCAFKTLVDCSHTKWDNNTGELLQLSIDDTKIVRRIYQDISKKRKNGVFMRNGGDIEYLTGSHWFTLEHCKMFGNTKNEGYGLFYKFQRDIFYLLEHIWKSNILGLYISKAKKTGITQIVDGGYCLNKGTSMFQWMIGFMSRNQDVAIENNMKLFLYAFDNLMMPLRPKVGYKAAKGGNIEFSELSKKNVIRAGTDEVLNTKVFCVPTSEHSFDSHFMNLEHMDEFPKYWQDSKKEPKEIYRNNKAGAKDQDDFRGRIIISSYPPEEDDIGSEQAAQIYRQSKLSTMKYGKTESELICYHIPAFKSLKSCIDKHGNCNELEAMEILNQNRDRVQKDRKALLAEVRQNPNNEDEAFGSNTQGSVFDPQRMAEIALNISETRSGAPILPYMEGRLEWENWKWELGLKNKRPKGEFCNVKFVSLTKEEMERGETGRLRIYRDVPTSVQNSILRNGRDEHGCIIPPVIYKYIYGADPTSHAAASEVIEGSKNSYSVMSRKDDQLDSIFRSVVSGTLDLQYFYRPELPDEAYEDLLKLIIYTGALGIVEANMPEFATRLIAEGLGQFCIVKDKEGNKCIWQRWMGLANESDKQYHLIRTTGNSPDTKIILESFVRLMIAYMQRPENGEKDYGLTIKDERLVEQLRKITKIWESGGSTKLFDMFMSWGYCLYADDIYTGLLLDGIHDMYSGANLATVLAAFTRD
jgi:hypothetical protein